MHAAHQRFVQLTGQPVPARRRLVQFGVQPVSGAAVARRHRPDRVLGAGLMAAEAGHGSLEGLPCLGRPRGAREATGGQQGHGLGAEAGVGSADRFQAPQGIRKALAADEGAGRAEADFQVAGEGALQARFVQPGGFRGLVVFEQRRGQAHLVLRGRRVFQRSTGFAHVARRVERADGCRHRAPRTVLEAGIRQVDDHEVHHRAEQGKREQDDQPVQLLPRANHVNRAPQREQDVQPQTHERHALSP